MSKQQSKQVFNTGNTQVSQTRDQGKSQDQQLQGEMAGYNKNADALFPGVASGYSTIAGTGGYSPEALNTLNSGYQDFINTGGIAPSDEAAMINKAGQVGRSAYRTGSDQLSRQIAATGGYGFTAANVNQLARGESEAASNATNNAEAALVGMKQSGKLSGLSGVGQTQQNLVGNQLNALNGSSQLYSTNVQAAQNTMQQILQNFATTGQLSNEDIKILSGIASEPGWGTNTINAIGTIGGAAAGVMSGLGKLKYGA